MNRLLLSIAVAALSVPASAQQYILVNNEQPIPAEDVVNITYEEDSEFKNRPLPNVLADDARVTLFRQALQLTGLADTLKTCEYAGYKTPKEQKYYYKVFQWNEVAWYNAERLKSFTVFAETDDVYAANGISNIDHLKAYAKQIYDEAYPEDAAISDPTDRRNSLNRFVAYHILPHGNSYWYLTYYDGLMTDKYTDTDLTDIATWYATMMPHASLKCCYPMAGDDSGLYLNRRGLKDGPDKYGKQVRGAIILAGEGEGKDPFTQRAYNGFYYYIDRILAYDQQTREDVLGSELWRVDFKTISPDIMNNAEDLRGNYLVDDDLNKPDARVIPHNGRNRVYQWNCIENIQSDLTKANAGIIARRAHAANPVWQGDEMDVLGDFCPITIKLPPLPAGEWEVRMGVYAHERRPDVKVYLNGQLTIDKLKLSKLYNVEQPLWLQSSYEEELRDYMTKTVFVVTERDDYTFLVTDVRTGEQIVSDIDPYRYYAGQDFTWRVNGTDVTTGERVNWTERATAYHKQAIKDYAATLPKLMKAPRECMSFTSNRQMQFPDLNCGRYVLGRLQSDGKSDNYLEIEACGTPDENSILQLDYLELVPKAVYDNPDIPEE